MFWSSICLGAAVISFILPFLDKSYTEVIGALALIFANILSFGAFKFYYPQNKGNDLKEVKWIMFVIGSITVLWIIFISMQPQIGIGLEIAMVATALVQIRNLSNPFVE